MKKIISLFLTVTMIASLIVAIPVTNVAATETITDEALFMTYSTYLSNSEMDEGLQKAEASFRAVMSSYSKTDELIAAFMTAMSEGISLSVQDYLGKLGLTETLYEKNAREAATKYIQSMLSNPNAATEPTKKIDTAYKALKTSYSVGSSVDKTKLMADLKKVATDSNINVLPKDMEELVDNLYDAGSLKKDLDAIGESMKLWKVVLELTEIHAIEKTAIVFTMEELQKAGLTNSDLYLGLSLLKSDIEKSPAEYVLKYYGTDKVVSYIAKKADDLIFTFATGTTIVPLVNAFTNLFSNYIYVNAKADALIQASMQASFVSCLDICLSNYRTKFINRQGTSADINKYEFLYSSYLGAYKAVLDSCYDVAKIDDKFSLGGDCMIWSSNIESIYTYDNYIKWCKEEIAHDIENAELDKGTGVSTITNALNEETIKARLDKIMSWYPHGSSWAGDFMGVSESLGYVCKNFNHIFDTSMVGMVQDNCKYILKSNVNVRLIGRLEEEQVTETALKELFSKARVGDVIITSGQYDYLHAMMLVEVGENGPVVYDVGSVYGPEQDPYEYTWLIQKYEFPYSKMADAFSSNGKYLTKPGISVYRAIKKVNTTNSGTSLYYEEYDDSVNYIIEDGVLKEYTGNRTTLDIPDGVTEIDGCAFDYNKRIRYVNMPDSVIKIGYQAFRGCYNLQSVKFSNNLETIGTNAFEYCEALRTVVIPGCPQLEDYAFRDCDNLANIILSDDIIKVGYDVFEYTAWYENQPEGAIYLNNVFYKYKYVENWECVGGGDDKSHWSHCTLTGYSPLPEDIDLVIKDGTRGIALNAIGDNHNSLYLPESLECASFGAFSNLNTIYYNPIHLDSSPGIWHNPGFNNDCSATTLYIGENVQTIPWGAFAGLKLLENVYYNAINCTDAYMKFAQCPNLTNVVIGENVQTIPGSAFEGTTIEKIVIPDSVTEIGRNAFEACTNLKNITLPQNSVSIGYSAFSNTAVEEITIPKQMMELKFTSIFSDCKNLKSITIEDGNERYYDVDGVVYDKIENELVFIPSAIETFTIPKEIRKIDYGNWNRIGSYSANYSDTISGEAEIKIDSSIKYKNLRSINVEKGNQYYVSDNGILYQGEKYPTLELYPAMIDAKEYTTPNNLWSFENGAFAGNDYLEKVYIKSDNYYSTKKVDYSYEVSALFAECSNLKYVEFNVPDLILGSGTFYNCQNLEGIKFPDGVVEIKSLAFAGCTKLETIEIPEGVTTVGGFAFYNCNSLKSICLPKTIEELKGGALIGCTSLTDIYYAGTEEEWGNICISTDLENVRIHYDYVAPTPEITTFTATSNDVTNATINLTIVNAPADAVVYVASYDTFGKLLELQKLTLNNGAASSIFSTSSVYKYKAFIWKGDTIRPLSVANEYVLE